MTEAEWLACTDPRPMLDFLRAKASDRKLRLLACACVDHVHDICYPHEGRYSLVGLGERFADSRIGVGAFRAARERFGAAGGVHSRWAVNCGGWAILNEDARDAASGAVDAAGWFFPLAAEPKPHLTGDAICSIGPSMKRRLFGTKPQQQLTVERLRRASPYTHHLCHRGKCGHPAKFTVFRNGEKVENLCRHHASCLCEEIGLHLPQLP